MKKRSFYRPFFIAAGLLMAAAAATAEGQDVLDQGFIVGEQVISDSVLDTGSSYVGDMSAESAGVEISGSSGCASGDCGGTGSMIGRSYGQPDLFYNYYTQGNVNTSNAQMYVSPLPVPPNVGHTFSTYQPFNPEEMLYWHKNRYHRYYDNGRGMNRTRAIYYSPPVRQAASNLYWNYLRLPR
ncbi:hypothetical protein Pla22_20220 [Rubripirellula amarantea]|uniref:Uncharacterized protein n=1 Tax=Rubripirellula amarantea TaxID=2527999 RepID=A0A5C5WWQ1_9BACT|nr:hypothetical protein [Rubripirellula amarantea]TWT54375.1 hypothetical protein Pla22_20220 [Rubripirellula amarantea]